MNSSHWPYNYFKTVFAIGIPFILSTCGQSINNLRISPQHVEIVVPTDDIPAINISSPDFLSAKIQPIELYLPSFHFSLPWEDLPIFDTSLIDFFETYYSAGEKFWDCEKYWRSQIKYL